jgi:hypothetical protein
MTRYTGVTFGTQNAGFLAERLAEFGALRETVIEIESEKASLEFTLAEAGGSSGR